ADGASLSEVVAAAERQAIASALRAANGNRREAAQQLGVSLRTLFYKIDRYGIT
ncbi:MAG: sigma-54-dependent Fis family transcriptional regulator, partial [Gemmatimonadetes bacterium]